MKFIVLHILILMMLSSCNSVQDNTDTGNTEATDTIVMPESTAYEFPGLEIPDGFCLDTITVYDSLSRAKYVSCFLVSLLPEMKEFNIAITEAMKERIRYEQSYVGHFEGNSQADPVFMYDLGLTEFYEGERIISITHVIDTYTEGGNHHNYSWFTFNFDKKKKKVIRLSDVFVLRNHEDSVAFVEFVIRNQAEDCMDWGLPFEPVDFSFADSGIFINPELSWACAQNRSFLPDDSLDKNYISKWVKDK